VTLSSRSGITTAQLKAAPPNAYYVWPVEKSKDYAEALAQALGRSDLTIISAHRFMSSQDIYGHKDRVFVIDHAVKEHLFPFSKVIEFREAIFRARVNGRVIV
jgi:hypothetical protein